MHLQRKITFIILFAFLIPFGVHAQSEQLYGEIGNLTLESGKVIKHCKVGYRVYGSMKPDESNVILFPTWFGGRSKDLAGSIGAKGMVDPSKFFIVTVDALGDGVSSSPSNSPAQPDGSFPAYTIGDMVHAEHELLDHTLGIHHIYAVIGVSMGGMQTFQWITQYPGFMDKAVPVVGSTRLTSYDKLLWTSELDAIEEGLKAGASAESIGKTIDDIHTLHLTTPDYWVEHTKTTDFLRVITQSYKSFEPGFNPYDWASQLRAMMALDVFKPFGESMQAAAKAVKAKVLVVVSLQDHMVNPHPALEFAPLIHAKILKLNNDCGHLGPGCASDTVNSAIRTFLSQKK